MASTSRTARPGGPYQSIPNEGLWGRRGAAICLFGLVALVAACGGGSGSADPVGNNLAPAPGPVSGPAPVPAPPPAPSGVATISWIRPTNNVDGSALTDISGYRIVYGSSTTNLPNSRDIAGPNTTSTTIGGLSAGTYFIAVMTLNSAGVASNRSGIASIVIE